MSSAMQHLDCYKVEVLYLLNPHLIWVEVRDPAIVFDDNEIKFEQIGIYGMLPLETTIAEDEQEITVQRCDEWVPAAAARIWEFLENEEEVFFIPTHLDRRSSIFDDNVHKFGDLVVKKKNGKIRSIIKVLKNTGFATYDVCMFHQFLSLGKINTKLSNIEIHNVITELEKYFIRKKVPKNKWVDPIKHQTSVFRVSYDLEAALTTTNLDKHNKNMKAILDSKNKDLELCKGTDEPSAGRGSTRRGKEKKKSALEKRLELMKNRKTRNGATDSDSTENKNNEHLQAFEDTKMLVEANAAPYSKKIYSKTDPEKVQILTKILNKTAKKVSEKVHLVNKLINETKEWKERMRSEDVKEPINISLSSTEQASITISSQVLGQEDIPNKSKNIEETNCVSDGEQLYETVEIAASISKTVQNELDKNDNHIVGSQQNENIMPSTNSKQESCGKIQEPLDETTLHEEQVRSDVSKNVDYYHHRRSIKGKSSKKGVKASKLDSRESPSSMKHGARNRSTSPLHKLAYPTRIVIREADLRNSKRVPDLPNNSEALTAKPISEQMVKKLMSTFKLTSSKPSEIIENDGRKCGDAANNHSEGVTAMPRCKNMIINNKTIEEIKEEGGPKNLVTNNLDVPLMQTASKNKLKKKTKKQNENNGQNNIVYGPPDDICAAVLAQKDVRKAENCAPLCTVMMSYGDCPDLHNCIGRHTILKDYDKPKDWMPKSGIITFKILHYHTATCYSARLIGHFDAETQFKYPSTYSHMSLTMGLHYAKPTNRIAFGIPKVGDVCAVALKHNLFCRAKVLKVSDQYGKGNVKNVLVHLIDEEIIETTSDIHLYHLPDDFRRDETYVIQVRLANIQPRDKDLVFSQLATDQLKEAISVKKNVFMKGRIVLSVANCIFVDTLEACQDLKSLNETVVIYNVKRELLEKHAEINPNHLPKIEEFCRKAELEVKPSEKKENESRPVVKVKPEISWAFFVEDMSVVEFGAVENPNTLFVRLTKFEDCMKILLSEIEKHVASSSAKLEDFEKGDIVLAEYPEDCVYERARIDEIGDKNIKCFFVDQGEWHQITKDKIKSISDSLITQLPFQSIECRLVGIQPPGDQWTDFATNWLFDKCSESATCASKQLYVKYFTKEPAQFTGGHKYGVCVIDTYGDEDIVLNQLMIDLNLAKEVNDEIKYLQHTKFINECEATCKEAEVDNYSWENESKYSSKSDSTPNKAMTKLIRSVPLVGTDDDSDCSDRWNINVTEDMARIFRYKCLNKDSTQDTIRKVPAIETNTDKVIEKSIVDSLSKNIDNCTSQLQEVNINPDSSKDLDSDDLSSPETVLSTTEASEKDGEILQLNQCQMRKPKLTWRQTRTSVTIKIQLIGADSYDLQIHDRSLKFVALVNDTNFGFEFDLYGVIDKKTASHSNKGQYILVKLNKIMHKNWLTLTKDGGIKKWIVYDVDSLDTTSDEEEVQNDNIYNIVKNMNNNSDSDSDEYVTYGAVDDVNFKYKNYE